jgi:hypothetical protein
MAVTIPMLGKSPVFSHNLLLRRLPRWWTSYSISTRAASKFYV